MRVLRDHEYQCHAFLKQSNLFLILLLKKSQHEKMCLIDYTPERSRKLIYLMIDDFSHQRNENLIREIHRTLDESVQFNQSKHFKAKISKLDKILSEFIQMKIKIDIVQKVKYQQLTLLITLSKENKSLSQIRSSKKHLVKLNLLDLKNFKIHFNPDKLTFVSKISLWRIPLSEAMDDQKHQ